MFQFLMANIVKKLHKHNDMSVFFPKLFFFHTKLRSLIIEKRTLWAHQFMLSWRQHTADVCRWVWL